VDDYRPLAAELQRSGILCDPWLDGRPRFSARPIILSLEQHRTLSDAAEAIAGVWHEAVLLCADDPGLVERNFRLTPFQRLMWESSAPAWHGIARADVFLTASGPQICELNCDTPSGEAEAVLLNQLACDARYVDPNRELELRFAELVEAAAARPGPLTIGILYPTELVEDLSMIALYRRCLAARGHRVILGAPFNLHRVRGRAALFDTPCDVFVRHYKTDWWAERESPFLDDERFPDAEPLARELSILLPAVSEGSCAVVNPFGAALAQNKRMMALMWEAIDRFSPEGQAAIRSFLPWTARLETVIDQVRGSRTDWVIKSDYGCEGAEVVVGSEVSDEAWSELLRKVIPERFIAQRRFLPLINDAGEQTNFGAYLIGGRFAGWFSRVHRGATGYDALAAATLIEDQHE
jgi:glutathionylspermidine synthase